MRVLANSIEREENNFDFLRWVAASMVIVSHEYAVLGYPRSEPVAILTHGFTTLGTIGVDVFFVISGFLVSKSLIERRSLLFFSASRALRIFPGLIAMLLLSTFVIGSICSSLPASEYLANRQTYTYISRNVRLHDMQWGLPGVFLGNPVPAIVNGSLWSLWPEVQMYLVLAGLGVLCLASRWRRARLIVCCGMVVAIVAGWALHGDLRGLSLEHPTTARLAPYFAIGAIAFCIARWWPTNWVLPLILGLATLAAFHTVLLVPLFAMFVAASVLAIAYAPLGKLAGWGRRGDVSYGLYIYAFPIQQGLVAKFPDLHPALHASIAYVLTLVCAVASWRVIESPSLGLKRLFRFGPYRAKRLATTQTRDSQRNEGQKLPDVDAVAAGQAAQTSR